MPSSTPIARHTLQTQPSSSLAPCRGSGASPSTVGPPERCPVGSRDRPRTRTEVNRLWLRFRLFSLLWTCSKDRTSSGSCKAETSVSELRPPRPGTKQALLIGLLRSEAGISIRDLALATGWQANTVHAALTTLRKVGYPITSCMADGGSRYRLVDQPKPLNPGYERIRGEGRAES
ncbi:MAG: DUF3489 domain-containing protein [Novosphingobium sp.]|uniref:DUF3489 domain-containing protein n=1 Tax=Novosphingobium sp. TaxID=1874826 RepID=UPI003016EFC2